MAGKTAIVTGASRGIGRAVAAVLAGRGVRVVAVARSQSALDALAREHRGVEVVAGDVCSAEVAERAVSLAVAGGRTLDALVLSAATVGAPCRIAELGAESALFERAMAVNCAAPLMWIRRALGDLRAARGRVLLLATVVGRDLGAPGMAAYAASKCAASAVVQCLSSEEAVEAGRTGAALACALSVSPGIVATDAAREFMDGAHALFPEDAAVAAIRAEIESVGGDGAAGKTAFNVRTAESVADAIARTAMHAPPALTGMFLSVDSSQIAAIEWPQ